MELLFPFAEYWWLYAGFTLFICAMLAVDLGVFHRDAHAVGFRESLIWSVVWIVVALAFCAGFHVYASGRFGAEVAGQISLEFLTGYVVERALAMDNIFVFVLVFQYFAVPLAYQHRVLFLGILGALIFRAAFVALGSVLMRYDVVMLLFGAFLLLTGVKLLWTPERHVEPDRNPIVRLLRRIVPITARLHGPAFLVRLDGRLHATPLFVALVFLEISDIVFAVDSVPAIFAITREPLIVFTSNVFAILGLRAMYFMLATAVERFHLLSYGLAFILIFVGLKMVWLNDVFDGHFPIAWSLGIITALLAASVIASLLVPVRSDTTVIESREPEVPKAS